MKSIWSRCLPLVGLMLASAPYGDAIAQSAPTPGGSLQNVKISAVDVNTFHLLAYQNGQAAPPVSPFVVKTAPWAGATVQNRATASSVSVPSGAFVLDANGDWQFTGRNNLRLSGTVKVGLDKTTFTLKHPPGERFYGAGNLKRDFSGDLTHPSGNAVVENGATRVPFLWSTGGYSVLVANNQTGAAWNDEKGTLTWTIPNSYADVYLSVAPTGYGLLDAYSRLTGPAPLPPRWTFGFLASKWGYADNADIRDKWYQFRNRQIPVDAFIYDYEWFQNDWEFNPKNFTPRDIADMHKLGLHVAGIRKPRVNGANLNFARQQGWVLSSPIGTDVRFDIPAAGYWWWSHHVPLVKAGMDGWWNDEAEQTMDEFMQMSRVQWDGWRAMSPRRSWIINRAFAPGIQRYGVATWTGDTHGSWENLNNQMGIELNWSLAGMPFTSNDIGGFENVPTPELYTRWIQASVFVPVMRIHCVFNEVRWPWAFGPAAEAATKKAIELRYRLIPYLYTCAEETTRTGTPLMRPLVLEYPQDAKTFNMRDEWLLGERLLAAPVMQEGGKREVYLPTGQWYDFNTGAAINGGQTLSVTVALDVSPTYVRAGTILPLGPVMQSTALGKTDSLEVRIYPGANATYSLYEDGGDDYDYQKGVCSRIPMTWDDISRTLTVGKRIGTFPSMLNTRRLVAAVPGKPSQSVTYEGRAIKVKF